ncbi:TPA: hypothetical protein ACH3X2_007605 [Trebouxia sp. C0005]
MVLFLCCCSTAEATGKQGSRTGDASHRGVSHCVGGLEVAGCKLKLTDAAGVGAVAQQGHASGQPALWLANHMLLYAIFYAMGMLKQVHADLILVCMRWQCL